MVCRLKNYENHSIFDAVLTKTLVAYILDECMRWLTRLCLLEDVFVVSGTASLEPVLCRGGFLTAAVDI